MQARMLKDVRSSEEVFAKTGDIVELLDLMDREDPDAGYIAAVPGDENDTWFTVCPADIVILQEEGVA